jgi:hypothetical protein
MISRDGGRQYISRGAILRVARLLEKILHMCLCAMCVLYYKLLCYTLKAKRLRFILEALINGRYQ